MATIAERMREALSLRQMKQADLVKATGIGKASISTYLSGEYQPKQKNIYKISKALNVSEAWLMGLDVPMQRSREDEYNFYLSDFEKKIIIAYRANPQLQEAVNRVLCVEDDTKEQFSSNAESVI